MDGQKILEKNYINNKIDDLVDILQKAMLYEAIYFPSPGLVSAIDSGAHKDMDIYTFVDSAIALRGVWNEIIELVLANEYISINEIYPSLKKIGIKAEEKMINSTNGINTHKGTIYIGVILCAALAFCLKNDQVVNAQNILNNSQKLSKTYIEEEIKSIKIQENHDLTTGIRSIRELNILGIRGEVLQGFPIVMNIGYPFLKKRGLNTDLKSTLGQLLLKIMANNNDTTLLNREFQLERINYVKNYASRCLELGGMFTDIGRKMMYEMQDIFVNNNLSPGGSADLLIATLTIYWWECYFE